MTPAELLNLIFGNGNFVFQNSDGNSVNVKDLHLTQHIQYDSRTRTLKVACPKCQTPVSPETREQLNENNAFNCLKCGNRYYETDLLYDNISLYLDLIGEESRQFRRFIEAVNHDLRTDDAKEAFKRCFQAKQIYGRTPEIYQWGALSLFFAESLEETIHNSGRKIIGYLEQSVQLDPKSQTYSQIAGSIATRYYQGVVELLEKTKAKKFLPPQLDQGVSDVQLRNHNPEYVDFQVKKQKAMFRYIREFETCYKIFPDKSFLETAILEVYGYNGISWIERRFEGWLVRFFTNTPGGYKIIRGYIYDFHLLNGNSDNYFQENEIKPMDYLRRIEFLLSKNHPDYLFPEVRVGLFNSKPVSINASLRLYQLSFYCTLIGCGTVLFYTEKYLYFILLCLAFAVFLHRNKPIFFLKYETID